MTTDETTIYEVKVSVAGTKLKATVMLPQEVKDNPAMRKFLTYVMKESVKELKKYDSK